MEYLRKQHKIIFSKNELKQIYVRHNTAALLNFLQEKGENAHNLIKNKLKAEQIVEEFVEQKMQDKENIEIFIALFCFIEVYDSEQKICFDLKDNVNYKNIKIQNLNDLLKIVKENTINDFGLLDNVGIREFQLKQYRGPLQTQDIFDFLKKKIKHYGNDLGDTNLLVTLRSADHLNQIDFREVHNRIMKLDLKFKGEVLIYHNENNSFYIVHQIYPEFKLLKQEIIHTEEWYTGKVKN